MGASFSQLPTIQMAEKLGLDSLVIDGSINAPYKNETKKFIVCDIKDHEAVLKIAKKNKVNGIVCPGTDFPYTAAYVADKLGLAGIKPDVARICTDKYEQRQFLSKAGFFVPKFFLVENKEDIKKNNLKFPLVIKPVDNMAARGMKLVKNTRELIDAYDDATQFSRSKKVIIEEFVDGMEFSIDALVYEGEVQIYAFADRHFTLLPYFIEFGHTCPTVLDKDSQNKINEVFIKAIKALGITAGAAKGDIRLTSKGIMITEIAARISGGFLSGWTYPFTSGIYQHENLLRIHLGQKPLEIKDQHLGFSAERCLLSIPGVLKEFINIDRVQKYAGVKLVHPHVNITDELKFPYNNAFRCGSVLSFMKSRSDAIYQAQVATSNIVLRLEPNNKLTDKWLKEDKKFQMFCSGEKELDWHGSDLEKALTMIKAIKGVSFNDLINTKNFWKYFYKGGIQGGLYALDSL